MTKMVLLMKCIKEKAKIEEVDSLLNKGSNPNYVDINGDSALHWCFQYRDAGDVYVPKIVSLLIDYGANVNAENKEGVVPLMLCVLKQHTTDTVNLLLDKGSNAGCPSPASTFNQLVHLCANYRHSVTGARLLKQLIDSKYNLNYVDIYNKGTPLLTFLKAGCSEEMVMMLLDAGADPCCSDYFTLSPLHYCKRYRPPEGLRIVKALVRHNADINTKDVSGDTPLTYLVINDSSIEMIECMLECGADPNSRNNCGKTALHYGSHYNKKKVVDLFKIFIQYNADINTKSNKGITPLVQFILDDNTLTMIRALLELGTDPSIPDNDGNNALHICTKYKGIDSIYFARLLIQFNVDINAQNSMGLTPLAISIEDNCNVKLTKLLLESGADPNIKTDSGEYVLHACSKFSGNVCLEFVQALIEHGADVNVTDASGQTALLRYIMKARREDSLRSLLTAGVMLKLTLDYNQCQRYFDLCVIFRHEHSGNLLVERFIESGNNVNLRHKETSETPLIMFVRNRCSVHMLEPFLEAGADPNMVAKKGSTAIHYAANYRYDSDIDVVRILLKYGADINVADNLGETPLMKFLLCGRSNAVITELLEKGSMIPPATEYTQNSQVLHTIARYYDDDFAEFLLNLFLVKGYSINSRKSQNKQTVLMAFLAAGRSKRIIEKLLDTGADPHTLDKNGDNCVHYITGYKDIDTLGSVLDLLVVKRVDLNIYGRNSRTVIQKCLFEFGKRTKNYLFCKKVLQLLLEAEADPNMVDDQGYNALHSFFESNFGIIKAFYIADGLELRSSDKDSLVASIVELLIFYDTDLFAVCQGEKMPVDLFLEVNKGTTLYKTYYRIIKFMLLKDQLTWPNDVYKDGHRRLHAPNLDPIMMGLNFENFDFKITECSEEIHQMKSTRIGGGSVTLHMLCTEKNPRKLARYYEFYKNSGKLVNDCKESFPRFFKLIDFKYNKGKLWKKIFDKVDMISLVSPSSGTILRPYDMSYVISYLGRLDLENLAAAAAANI